MSDLKKYGVVSKEAKKLVYTYTSKHMKNLPSKWRGDDFIHIEFMGPYKDGHYYEGGLVKYDDTEIVANKLLSLKESAKNKIDFAAGEARSRFITTSVGQSAVYLAKESEAREYKRRGYPEDLTLYPFMKAESESLNITPTQAADIIIALADQWSQVAALIEKVRLYYKAQIDSIDILEDKGSLEVILKQGILALSQIKPES